MKINQTIRNANATGQGGECANQSDYTQIIFPKPDSVKGRVLGALLRGEQLTHLDCWRRFGSARLSHHIYMLRNEGGWPVEMIEQEVKTSDAGRTASIGIYTLPQEAITSAGDVGQQYAAEALRVELERRAA
jgi:hypothetical protein